MLTLLRRGIRLRVIDLYTRPEPTISFEFFPPKTDEAEQSLLEETVPALKLLGADFISVTYGAGGGTRARTLRIVDRIRREFAVESVAHLTCVGSTQEMIADLLNEIQSLGIENLLALRGDPPRGEKEFKPVPGGFAYAVELVRYLRGRGDFVLGVAGYPEGHVECADKQLDWDRTAAKVEAGADFIITQLFYDPEVFLQFENYLRHRHKVKVPIIPGVLPFLSAEQINRFTSLCGSQLGDGLARRLEALAHDDESVRQLGVEVCTEICDRLLNHGVPGIHLYCLNRVKSCSEILHNLGLAKNAEHPDPRPTRVTQP
jgi:methylenetetrahydrofolate reductase (NADPH)